MVVDFLEVKKVLKGIVEEFDHRVILPGNCPYLRLKLGDEVEATTDGKRYVFPAEDVVIIDAVESSAEEMARVILDMLVDRMRFPKNVTQVEVGVYEEQGQAAWATKALR